MALNEEQKKQLAELERLAKEPAAAAYEKSATFIVDLRDKASVAMAKTLGLLPNDDSDGDRDGDDGQEGDPKLDDGPKRRSYFPG